MQNVYSKNNGTPDIVEALKRLSLLHLFTIDSCTVRNIPLKHLSRSWGISPSTTKRTLGKSLEALAKEIKVVRLERICNNLIPLPTPFNEGII